MAVSPFDHPILSGLVGDAELAGLFSVEAELAAMLRFERVLAEAEAAEGVIPAEAGRAIVSALDGFEPNVAKLRLGAARDGVAVPELVAQLREAVGPLHGGHVHFGATSQDVVDTGLSLRLKTVLAILDDRIAQCAAALGKLGERHGAVEVMAHTRMQAAIPVTALRKIESWRAPLVRSMKALHAMPDTLLLLHFGGAAGTLDKLQPKAGDAVRRRMAGKLGLKVPSHVMHSERDVIVGFASLLSLITGSLGKMGQDVALAAQSEVGEIRLAAGGGSSAMPHKVNPVDAETLVALARFNATLVSGMHHSLIHENERSGAAWTLEWMLLPQMILAAGAALTIATRLAETISFVPLAERG